MAQDLPFSPTGTMRAKLTSPGSQPVGTPVRFTRNPSARDGYAEVMICGDGDRPHGVVIATIDDATANGSIGSPAAAQWRARAGAAFKPDEPLKVSKGKYIAAAAGDKFVARALTESTATDDLVLAVADFGTA